MNIQEQEELDFYRDSASDVDRFDVQLGAANRNDTTSDWLLSDRDVWYPNPYFVGERGPHPESSFHDGYDICVECGSETDNGTLHHGIGCRNA